jgi:hypothetical protein
VRQQTLRQQALRREALRRNRIDRLWWERHEASRRAQLRRAPGRSIWFDRGFANRPGRGIVHLAGEVTAEGLRCTALRGDDGRLYTLEGDVFGVRPGDDVQVAARVVRNSACRQGTTLAVHDLRFLDRADPWRDDRWDPRPVYGPGGGIRLGEYVEIDGRLTDESWDCRTMRGRDDRLFSLLGDLEGFDPGDRVEVDGRLAYGTGCPGTTIRVDDVRDDGGSLLDRIFGRDDDWDDDRYARDRWGDRAADGGELVELHGWLGSAGGCPAIRAEDGRTYELAGNLGGYGRGDRVRLIGVAEGGSRCGIGPSLRVAQIDRT